VKVLHTSDWHVGKTLRGRDRGDEFEAVLGEVGDVARREQVDLVLVVGDLFDTAAPTADAERIVYRALLDLSDRGRRPVVIVGGNHDNQRRLGAVRPLLDLGSIHVQPGLAAADRGGVLELDAGGDRARIALLPFLSQRWIVRADDLMALDADQHQGQFRARMAAVVEHLTAGFDAEAVNLVAAHLMVDGGTMGGGERSAHTVFEYSVPSTVFPATCSYVALGHLHRPQAVPGPCPIRYSGSPLQLDFGETADSKAVTIVEAKPGTPASIREVPLSAGRRLRTLRGTLAELEALQGDVGDDHLRLVVREAPRVGLGDEVRGLFPNAVDVVVERPSDGDEDRPTRTPSRGERTPIELFNDFLADRGEEDPKLAALFRDLYDQVSSADEGEPLPTAADADR
jgi:exonuclease SbcD